MKRLPLISLLIVCVLVSEACASASLPPTLVPSIPLTDPVAAPTVTLQPTNTPAPTPTVAIKPSATPTVVSNTIIDFVANNGSFKTLITALQAAGLVDTLKSTGPYTLFAPTDAAFARLPKGTFETLLKPENKAKLIAILLYHIVPGRLGPEDVTGLKQATTLGGPVINIAVNKDQISINNAHVIGTEISPSNGVIYVINTVLMPPDGPIP